MIMTSRSVIMPPMKVVSLLFLCVSYGVMSLLAAQSGEQKLLDNIIVGTSTSASSSIMIDDGAEDDVLSQCHAILESIAETNVWIANPSSREAICEHVCIEEKLSVVGYIGEGSYGFVLRVEDTQSILNDDGESFALKIGESHSVPKSEHEVMKVLQEAADEASMPLISPRPIRVFDIKDSKTMLQRFSYSCILMEYLHQGTSLRDAEIDDIHEAAVVAHQLADALVQLSEVCVCHNDLSDANIWLEYDPKHHVSYKYESLRIRIIDFGLADFSVLSKGVPCDNDQERLIENLQLLRSHQKTGMDIQPFHFSEFERNIAIHMFVVEHFLRHSWRDEAFAIAKHRFGIIASMSRSLQLDDAKTFTESVSIHSCKDLIENVDTCVRRLASQDVWGVFSSLEWTHFCETWFQHQHLSNRYHLAGVARPVGMEMGMEMGIGMVLTAFTIRTQRNGDGSEKMVLQGHNLRLVKQSASPSPSPASSKALFSFDMLPDVIVSVSLMHGYGN